MKKKKILLYAAAIALPLAVGGLSALVTMGSMDIYGELETPPLSPPSIAFPIVWSVLYVLMGISSAIIWQKRAGRENQADGALVYYLWSLVFNFFWSLIFFKFRLFLAALVCLLALWYTVLMTIRAYWPLSKAAALLQLPYLFWVSFAGYLNAGIWALNR